jgi:hypothetical protein
MTRNVTIRMDDRLYERLQVSATAESRSLNNLITRLLEASLGRDPTKKPSSKRAAPPQAVSKRQGIPQPPSLAGPVSSGTDLQGLVDKKMAAMAAKRVKDFK